jgi:glutamine---fructose-6-phosphate transaminase (isomerizing)
VTRSDSTTWTFREAAQTSARVAAQLVENRAVIADLAAALRAKPPRAVVTCARGSSDHAATFAKYLIETRAGVLTASAAPSISSVYAAQPDLAGALFIAISQSGASPDLLAAARMRARRARVSSRS